MFERRLLPSRLGENAVAIEPSAAALCRIPCAARGAVAQSLRALAVFTLISGRDFPAPEAREEYQALVPSGILESFAFSDRPAHCERKELQRL